MISYDICLSLSDFLSMIISRSNHVAANGIIAFFFMANINTTSSSSTHLSMDIEVAFMYWLL